jgi:hypothetical protein
MKIDFTPTSFPYFQRTSYPYICKKNLLYPTRSTIEPFHKKACFSFSFCMKQLLKKIKLYLGFAEEGLPAASSGQLILESLLKLDMSIQKEEPLFFAKKHLNEMPEEEQEEFFRTIGVAIKEANSKLGKTLFEEHLTHPAVEAALQARINHWKIHTRDF